MKIYKKPRLSCLRDSALFEPGPAVLVSSAGKDERYIRTIGWHMVMEFTPSLVGCLISRDNHSYG